MMSYRTAESVDNIEPTVPSNFAAATRSEANGAKRLTRYVLSRIGQAIGVLWLAYTLIFVAIALLPVNPIVQLSASESGIVDPQTVEQMKRYYGYDRNVVERYFIELGHVAQGGLGYSISTGQTVAQAISEAAPPTLRLAATAFSAALLITFLIVAAASLGPWRWLRESVLLLPPLFAAAPVFWVGVVALTILSFKLHLISVFPDGTFLSILVPSVVLALPLSAAFSQVLLKSVETVYASEFIDVVRAKGAGPKWVFFRHVVRNAAAPGLTVAGHILGTLVGGTVVTETVFARAGVGRALQAAVTTQDSSLVQGFILIIAAVYVVLNLIIDLLYPVLDPRILLVRGTTRG
ncbi:ABC transporter permease [Bordetella genomosp. 10]|uniref:ABC transporter permease n=1 Tax=Bordetella genomosp. 10 TaxID=1416804 RepID=UPI001C5327A9|nr:ABC transporter permease [Bordetella genomosp. 10]